MPTKSVYFLVVPGFADWEGAHALAEVRRHGHYEVKVVGLNQLPVQSMGGMTVQPTCALTDIDPEDVALFMLPGGDRWEQQPPERELLDLLVTLDACAVPIAAICAATTVVARAGLLHGRRHTSNGLDYLNRSKCPPTPRRQCTWTPLQCGIAASLRPAVWPMSSLHRRSWLNSAY